MDSITATPAGGAELQAFMAGAVGVRHDGPVREPIDRMTNPSRTHAALHAARCTLAGALLLPAAGGACTMVEVAEPVRGAVLQERQPTIRWHGDAAGTYRVQLMALLPEARIVATHDLEVTGTQFRLPAPLPVERAAIKVLVSRGCTSLDAQDLHAQGARFFVDVRGACTLAAGSAHYRQGTLSWQPLAAAQSYKVRLFRGEAVQGTAASAGEEVTVQGYALALPAPVPGAGARSYAVATIQPVCQGLPGRATAVRLAGD